MLVEFAVKNFRSFKEMQKFTMEAAPITSKNKRLDKENIFIKKNINLVKFKAIYGSNGSGKSNLIKAMASFWKIIDLSLFKENTLPQYISSFRLSEETNGEPTFFQMIFIHEGIEYRYGFEADHQKIHAEWLFVKNKKEVPYFIRENQEITYYNKNNFSEIKPLLKTKKDNELFRPNSLILSAFATHNGKVSRSIRKAITGNVIILPMLDNDTKPPIIQRLLKRLEDEKFRLKLLDFIKKIDDTIVGIEKAGNHQIIIRKQVGLKKTTASFSLVEEAEGTKKMIYLAPFLFLALDKGGVLILDELEANLHPILSEKIIGLFNSKTTNPKNAQLIITTHNTNLLDPRLIRRDQVLFVDRNNKGESTITDLFEYKRSAETDSFETDYLLGLYGGIPSLNSLHHAFTKD